MIVLSVILVENDSRSNLTTPLRPLFILRVLLSAQATWHKLVMPFAWQQLWQSGRKRQICSWSKYSQLYFQVLAERQHRGDLCSDFSRLLQRFGPCLILLPWVPKYAQSTDTNLLGSHYNDYCLALHVTKRYQAKTDNARWNTLLVLPRLAACIPSHQRIIAPC
jgi:hypothetical protein